MFLPCMIHQSISNSVSLRQMLVQLSLGQMRRKIVAAAASADISPITSIAVAIGPVVPCICNFQSISLISIYVYQSLVLSFDITYGLELLIGFM